MKQATGRKPSGEEQPDHPVGIAIKQLLGRRNRTQLDLAHASLIDLGTINKMIKGKRLSGPSLRERLLSLIEGLNQLGVLNSVEEANQLLHAIPTIRELDPRVKKELSLINLLNQSATPIQPALSLPLTKYISTPPSTKAVNSDTAPLFAGDVPLFPQLFLGREADLEHLITRLAQDSEQPATPGKNLVVVRGWPGVGKSTLATVLAYNAYNSTLSRYFPDGVLWTSLGQNPDPLGALQKWAAALNLPATAQLSTTEELTRRVNSALYNKQVLVIIDDAWEEQHVQPLLVGWPGSATIVTTRLPLLANLLAPKETDIYLLKELSEESALELLNLLARTAVKAYDSEARQLVQAVEYLPLAIQVAGRMLRIEASRGLNIQKMLGELMEGTKILQSQALVGDVTKETNPTVEMLLRKSTDYLDPLSRECFIYLAGFAAKPSRFGFDDMSAIWQEILLENGSAVSTIEQLTQQVVSTLVDRGLLENVDQAYYVIHALLILHARSLLVAEVINF